MANPAEKKIKIQHKGSDYALVHVFGNRSGSRRYSTNHAQSSHSIDVEWMANPAEKKIKIQHKGSDYALGARAARQ
jgi:hemin uptake protein HemP